VYDALVEEIQSTLLAVQIRCSEYELIFVFRKNFRGDVNKRLSRFNADLRRSDNQFSKHKVHCILGGGVY